VIIILAWCPPATNNKQEDIYAQFGETVAVHCYGATNEEQAELEKAAEQDEAEGLKA
jgi:hypothetical protein